MYSLVLVVVLSSDIWTLPMFSTSDNQPVYMHTQRYIVALGQFETIADCEAYRVQVPRPFLPFTFDFTDADGFTAKFPLIEAPAYPPRAGQFYVQGCA